MCISEYSVPMICNCVHVLWDVNAVCMCFCVVAPMHVRAGICVLIARGPRLFR